jgi:hypothetical protein
VPLWESTTSLCQPLGISFWTQRWSLVQYRKVLFVRWCFSLNQSPARRLSHSDLHREGPGSPFLSPFLSPNGASFPPFLVLKNYLTFQYSTAHHASHIPMSSLCFRALWILTPAIGGLTLPVEGPQEPQALRKKPQHEVIHWLTIGQAASRRVASLGTKKNASPKRRK